MGYTPADYARIRHFTDTAEALDNFLYGLGEQQSANGMHLNAPWALGNAALESKTCGSEDGGWKTSSSLLPADWLPPKEAPCAVDVVDADEFDIREFIVHYLLQGRPLLVRGGGKMKDEIKHHYSRAGLLKLAGSHELALFEFPYANLYTGVEPQSKNVSEYIAYLDSRDSIDLLYAFINLRESDTDLFAYRKLPIIFDDLADHFEKLWLGTQFNLGGELMGSPLHFHNSAVNSLVFGRKLWFLLPPARQVWSNEPIYQHLLRTGGLPDSIKCIQEAGDLMFVPDQWTHGVINLAESIGVAHELTYEI